jgi:hypothetical protein
MDDDTRRALIRAMISFAFTVGAVAVILAMTSVDVRDGVRRWWTRAQDAVEPPRSPEPSHHEVSEVIRRANEIARGEE